jgi:hypothetical protein
LKLAEPSRAKKLEFESDEAEPKSWILKLTELSQAKKLEFELTEPS